jgi:signal transduction histidine kinase
VVQAHGGSIALESRFGRGATVVVRLPRMPAAREVLREPAEP